MLARSVALSVSLTQKASPRAGISGLVEGDRFERFLQWAELRLPEEEEEGGEGGARGGNHRN